MALEERHDCVWDDRTCYRELQNSLLGAAELFISNEDLVKPEDQTYAKFRVRLARRFGKMVYTNKWQAAIALGDRVKKTEESYGASQLETTEWPNSPKNFYVYEYMCFALTRRMLCFTNHYFSGLSCKTDFGIRRWLL